MEFLFGKNRWIYWMGMLVLIAGTVIILARRKSPEEIARIKLVRGDEAMEAGHYEQAEVFYRSATEKDPTLLAAYYNLALATEYRDDREALRAWEAYLKRAASVPEQEDMVVQAREHWGRLAAAPHVERAEALRARKDYPSAAREYNIALGYYPNDLQTLTAAAANEAAGGSPRNAAGLYERALVSAPYSMNIRYAIAVEYEKFDKRKAAATYRELLKMSETQVGISPAKLKDAQQRLAALRREGYDG